MLRLVMRIVPVSIFVGCMKILFVRQIFIWLQYVAKSNVLRLWLCHRTVPFLWKLSNSKLLGFVIKFQNAWIAYQHAWPSFPISARRLPFYDLNHSGNYGLWYKNCLMATKYASCYVTYTNGQQVPCPLQSSSVSACWCSGSYELPHKLYGKL